MPHLSHEQIRAYWRVIPLVYLACAVVLVPWTIYLACTLPKSAVADHYRLAWVGFDIVLVIVLLRVSLFAWRRDPRLVLVSAVASVMLAVDAWFDIMTSADGAARPAVIAAICFEVPGSLVCAMLARGGLRELLRRASIEQHPARGHH